MISKSLKKARVLSRRLGVIKKSAPIKIKKNPAEIALKSPSPYACGKPSFKPCPSAIYFAHMSI
jgi:hypothetical protein